MTLEFKFKQAALKVPQIMHIIKLQALDSLVIYSKIVW